MSDYTGKFPTYIANDRDLCYGFQNLEPDTNVLSAVRDGPAKIAHQFVGIDSDFKNIVGEGKERRQGKGSHEYRDEAVLDDWKGEKGSEKWDNGKRGRHAKETISSYR